MRTIIFVDDTPAILNVYRRLFMGNTELRCFFFEEAGSVLECMENYKIDILVSDLEMPIMDGISLLRIVKQNYPSVVRIIISGAALTDRHFEVIRLAHRFFRKPANLRHVYDAIKHTFEVQKILMDSNAGKLLGDIEIIPSYPFIIDKIEREIESDDCSLKEVANIISKDAGMTSNILKLANSDYLGLSNEITSPLHAVTMIGIEGIKGIIMSHIILEDFPLDLCKTFEIAHFREHSFATAQFARAIGVHEKLSDEDIETLFVAGLLHDVGRLILEVNYTKTEILINEHLIKSQGMGDLDKLERDNIGISHSEAAAYILGLWGVKNSIIETILQHHQPSHYSLTNFPKLTAILHCADQFAYSLYPKFPIDGVEKLDMPFLTKYVTQMQINQWRESCAALVNTFSCQT